MQYIFNYNFVEQIPQHECGLRRLTDPEMGMPTPMRRPPRALDVMLLHDIPL